ncbi:MAG: ABC transporter ATP-binding protein [Planctomycetota bacterium]|nr:ABC transporter ATP-binding protein [Planctomycetota bacterium]
MPDAALVEVQDLVKTYGPLRAVDGLSFQVRAGEVVGLLGANGAGKSTLMKVLTCYLVADGGTAQVAGLSIDKDPVGVRRHIGYLPENAPLYAEMRVKEFLEFVGAMRGLRPKAKLRERIEWAVSACGLQPKYMAPIGTLSRGYRQRVGIAQAVLHDPDLLILDEPTSGLDPIQIIEIRRLIQEIGRTKTVFFSTHIMQEVEAVCSRAIIVSKGKLVADGSPSDLKHRQARGGRLVARLRGADADAVRKELESAAVAKRSEVHALPDLGLVECILHIGENGAPPETEAVNAAGQAFFEAARKHRWAVLELHGEGMSLEDAFLAATGHAHRKEDAPEKT